jgi:hypothetical protein
MIGLERWMFDLPYLEPTDIIYRSPHIAWRSKFFGLSGPRNCEDRQAKVEAVSGFLSRTLPVVPIKHDKCSYQINGRLELNKEVSNPSD